jgi:Mg-chelatase subunit ChlI
LEQRVDLALKITEQRKKIRNLSPEELIQIGEWADQLNELNSSSIPANRQRKQVSIAEKIKGYLKSGNIT